MTAPPRPPLPNGVIGSMARGVAYPLEALRYISGHGLWPLTLVAIAINAVLLVVLMGAAFWLAIPWLRDLDAWLLGGESGLWLGVLELLSWLMWTLAMILGVAFSAVLVLLLGQAVASPFLEALSEKVEALQAGAPELPGGLGAAIKSIVFAFSDVVWSLLFLLAVNLPLWVVGVVIPGPGTLVAGVLSFVFSALILAQEFVTMPAARRMVAYRGRWSMVWRNKWLALGFGAAVMAFMVVPGLNLVLLPLAAVGGTLAYCDLQAAGRLGPRD